MHLRIISNVFGPTSLRVSSMPVVTRAGGRIHFGLVDLTGATPRAFGGIGAMLAEPAIRVVGTQSSRWSVTGLRSDVVLRERVLRVLHSFQQLTGCSCMKLRIEHALPRHHGLGSGTTTILSCLASANAISSAGLSDAELVRLSGRGGASGTGVNGFWRGGWIIDCGQESSGVPMPSGSQSTSSPSMMVQRISPPPWSLDVYMPPSGRLFSGSEEEAIFREASQDHRQESLEALALLYHGLVPALLSRDLEAFGSFMGEFQSRGLKKHEIARQHSSVRTLMRRMTSAYPCVAMSSMGPAVVGIRESANAIPTLSDTGPPSITTCVDDKGVQLAWVE